MKERTLEEIISTILSHSIYKKSYLKLKESEKEIFNKIVEESISIVDGYEKTNKMFRDQLVKPKNWLYLVEAIELGVDLKFRKLGI